jgi:hypothetical protein
MQDINNYKLVKSALKDIKYIDFDADPEDEDVYMSANLDDGGAEIEVPVWKTKDGTFVEVPHMTDSHLVNAIKYLERKAVTKAIANDRQYHNTLELATETYQCAGKNIYLTLISEATKRGILKIIQQITPQGIVENYRKWLEKTLNSETKVKFHGPPKAVRKIIL